MRPKLLVELGLMGPITDLLWHQSKLYISHRTKVSIADGSGKLRDIVTDLPSLGDHHNNPNFPYGLAWTSDNRLIASENGFDDRGSRPIDNAPDTLWEINQGAWYGWPDFASGMPITDQRFKPSNKGSNDMLMAEHPLIPKPLLLRPPHSAMTQLAISKSQEFGYVGRLFLGEFGDMAPLTGSVDQPTGYGVYSVDLATNRVASFVKTKVAALGPKGLEYVATAGLKRPVDVYFSPSGNTLYIDDIGAFAVPPTAAPMPMPMETTGLARI